MKQSIKTIREIKYKDMNFEIKRVDDFYAHKTFYVLICVEYIIDDFGKYRTHIIGHGVVCDKNITAEEAYKLWVNS